MVAGAESPHHSCTRTKRVKTVDSQIPQMKNCIVCNQAKCQGDSRKLRIYETKRAKQFLSAIKFNKEEVFTRCILCKAVGDIFAADVMYHKNCMTNYMKFQRDVGEILDGKDDQCHTDIVKEKFREMVSTLELDKEGYAVSGCRDVLNNNLIEGGVGKSFMLRLVVILKGILFFFLFNFSSFLENKLN